MRSILFRGKRENGEWVYGYYYAKPILEKRFIQIGEEQWLIKENTLSEYTGLLDKNGNKIFEWDYVKTEYGRICEVVWFWQQACFDLVPVANLMCIAPSKSNLWNQENLEIVGNRYDTSIEELRNLK